VPERKATSKGRKPCGSNADTFDEKIGTTMNVSMPSRLVDILTNAPKRAVYENLQVLGCKSVKQSRSIEWGLANDDGVAVITLWDDCISRGPKDEAACDIPTAKWRADSEGSQVGKADRLIELLKVNVGKLVRGLICERRNADGTASIGRSVADMRKWLVTDLGQGNFRLIRQDRAVRDAAGA